MKLKLMLVGFCLGVLVCVQPTIAQVPEAPKAQETKATSDITPDASGAIKISRSPESDNRTAYIEGTAWKGDFGIGALLSHSEGESRTSKSSWDINFIGAQVGVKGGNTFTTKDGKVEKSTWQVKGRLGVETLETSGSKGQPDKNQKALLAGAYVEKLMTDGKCLWGYSASGWLPVGILSSNGKTEDRTSIQADIRRECPINEQWSWRAQGGPGWSDVSGIGGHIGLQLRYKTKFGITIFAGPDISKTLGKDGFTVAGLIGFQVGGIDEGMLHNKYVKDHQVVATGRKGGDVFSPVAALSAPPAPVNVATVPAIITPAVKGEKIAPIAQAKLSETDEEIRQALEVWWAEQKKS